VCCVLCTAQSMDLVRRECNGPIDGSWSIFSDLFDREHDNPEALAAIAEAVDGLYYDTSF
jgi:hypothetical protein